MTRAPSAGGKTRVFAELGTRPDRRLLEALLLDTLDAAHAPGVSAVVCYTPPGAGAEIQALLPPGVQLLPQRGGNLGERMAAAFDDLFTAGARTVTLVGSDLPLLDPAAVADAHARLAANPARVVLGPAEDGGYFLIGATRTPRAILDGLAWGTSAVLAETRRLAAAAGLALDLLPEGMDVDSVAGLRAVVRGNPERGQRTRAWAREALPGQG